MIPRNAIFRLALAAILLSTGLLAAQDYPQSVWQWSTSTPSENPQNGEARAFLWIPPNCKLVRGVVLAQDNMEERTILENPRFRSALSDMGIAEVFVTPFFDHLFRFNQGAGDVFDAFMHSLANKSGYRELDYAPVITLGHSAAASWPYYFAAWDPERTLAAISVSGQWPYFRNPMFAPDIWGTRTIDYIPALESMGEFESASTWSNEGLKERKQHPLMPLSMLANPAQGHFANSNIKSEYLALYIRKAMQYRFPASWDGASAPKLNPIDPTKTGWLVQRWKADQAPTAPPAPVGQFKGNPDEAFWFFDEEIAKATDKYQSAFRGLKQQYLSIYQDDKLVPHTKTHIDLNANFEPEADGVTFHLIGAYHEVVPDGDLGISKSSGKPVGAPLEHQQDVMPDVDVIQGPFVKIGPQTFRISLRRDTQTIGWKPYDLTFAVSAPGNKVFKPAVQQGHLLAPSMNKDGLDQSISFAKIPNQKLGTVSVKLSAKSNAQLPVSFFVREGPAVIDGDTLTFTEIPPRAKFPMDVTVVAWQWGTPIEPKVNTAEPVVRTFHIVR